MSGRVEKLLKAYPEMIQKRDCLAYQLAHFKGLSAEDVIDSMMTPKVDGERVKSSRLSDKTAQIALEYRDRSRRASTASGTHIWRSSWQHVTRKFISSNPPSLRCPSPLHELMPMFSRASHLGQLAEKHHLSRATWAAIKKERFASWNVLLEART